MRPYKAKRSEALGGRIQWIYGEDKNGDEKSGEEVFGDGRNGDGTFGD